MKASKLLIVTLILGVFQLTLLEYFRIFGIKPDLLLVTVVMASLFLEMRWAIVFGVGVGIFKDIFGLSPFGLNILLFGLWSFLSAKISRKISIEDNLSATLLVWAIALLQNITSGLVLIYSGNFVPLGIFLRISLLASLYTAFTLPLILKVSRVRI